MRLRGDPTVPLDPVSPGVAEEEHAPKTAKHAKTAAARIHFMNLSTLVQSGRFET